jgi:hypothetical protein
MFSGQSNGWHDLLPQPFGFSMAEEMEMHIMLSDTPTNLTNGSTYLLEKYGTSEKSSCPKSLVKST